MYVPHFFSFEGFEASRGMSLKVHTIDRHHRRLPPLQLGQESDSKQAAEAPTYAWKEQDIFAYVSKLNSTRGYNDTTQMLGREETQPKLEREEAFDHFLEVPDDGLVLKRKDVTFSFWFLVPEDYYKSPPRFMTFLQGHIEVGGYFVITKGTGDSPDKLIGGFDESTGEFVHYNLTTDDLKLGWNSCAVMVQSFATKYCNVSVVLNGALYCQQKPVSLLSNLKFIGNSADGFEPFFHFVELRVFDRIVSHDEFVFMNRMDRVARKERTDDRVSHFDLVNAIYDEFTAFFGPKINQIVLDLLVAPGNNFVAALDIMAVIARNGTCR